MLLIVPLACCTQTFEKAIAAGAEDIEETANGKMFELSCSSLEAMMKLRATLQDEHNMPLASMKVAMVPDRLVELTEDSAQDFFDMLDAIDDWYV
jgi:transcriptional/translational regulatory protein YebC/TACO1